MPKALGWEILALRRPDEVGAHLKVVGAPSQIRIGITVMGGPVSAIEPSRFVPRRGTLAEVRIDRVLWSARSVAHIARHEVTPEEVEDVLFSPPLDARRGKREGTYLVCRAQSGRTSAPGRHRTTPMYSLVRRYRPRR